MHRARFPQVPLLKTHTAALLLRCRCCGTPETPSGCTTLRSFVVLTEDGRQWCSSRQQTRRRADLTPRTIENLELISLQLLVQGAQVDARKRTPPIVRDALDRTSAGSGKIVLWIASIAYTSYLGVPDVGVAVTTSSKQKKRNQPR